MKKMIMAGGLGNQMFQYALLLSLRNRGYRINVDTSMYGSIAMHNGYELDKVFGISEDAVPGGRIRRTWIRLINKFKPKWLCTYETQLIFDESVLLHPHRYIIGYWQNELYFKNVEGDVRSAFVFKGIDKVNQKIAQEMENTNSVAMHIRRGDYAKSNMTLLKDDYYQKAVSFINSKVESPVFYLFSDDKEEAARIASQCNIFYKIIDVNSGRDSYKDMFLLSRCKHNIIANSSFSWWGAWLNANIGKIVIAPQVWIERRPEFKPQCKDWILV